MRTYTSLVALLFALTMGASVTSAATQYWDIDIIDRAGAGNDDTPIGTWSSFTNSWNSNSTGVGIPTLWVPGNTAVFAAGSNATGTYNVNVSGTISVGDIFVEEGFPAQNNGTLAFGAITASINVATGAGFGQTSGTAIMSGTGGIIKNGGGVLALRGANSFSRAGSGNQAFLNIKEGTVDIQADANLGAVPSATNAAALTINGGTLRYSGSAAIALNANRGVTIGANGGTIQVLNNTTFALSANSPATAALSGSGTLTKTGDGRFRLQTAQTTFTGKYVVKAGSLVFPSEDRLGALPTATQADYFTLDGGGLYGDLSTGLTIDAKRGITLAAGGGYLSVAGTGLSYDGIISGTSGGALSIAPSDAVGSAGTGPILLNSANTYNGPTLIGEGATLSVGILTNGGINSGIGSSSSAATNLILDGGTLKYRGAGTSTDRNFTITVTGAASIDASGTNNAPLVFTNTAPIALNGAGPHVLTLRGSSTGDNTLSQQITNLGTNATTLSKNDGGTWVLKNTANSYTGNTVISGGGWLKLGASGVIPDLSLVQLFSSSTFDLNGFDETVRSISGASGTIALGTKTLTINDPNAHSFTGAIIGTGGGRIIKNGGGYFTLSPTTATYDGGFTLNGGTLGIGTNVALGTGTFAINNIATLAVATTTALSPTNAVTLNGNLTINDTFTATPGAINWGTSGANKWTITGGERTITVNTAAAGYGVTINQPIAQDAAGRGLVKQGNGTLTLTGTNTYTGDTKVLAGTLSIAKTYLADWAAVFLNSTATLNLNFAPASADTIAALCIDGIFQPTGTWGAVGSGAEHETPWITGPGKLLVETWFLPMSGDFNSDGKVDMGDYVTWRRANGSNNALPNDNGLGTPVGLEHYNLWRQLYGRTPASGSSGGLGGGNIPEPTATLLLLLGTLYLPFFRVSRRGR